MRLLRPSTWAAAAVTLAAAGGPAGAQQPAVRPAVSPYLNLLRPGSPGFLNYYGLVRPQQQNLAAISGLQQQVGGLNTAVTEMAVTGGPGGAAGVVTGHGFGYFTHRAYFQTTGGAGGGLYAAPGLSGLRATAGVPGAGLAPAGVPGLAPATGVGTYNAGGRLPAAVAPAGPAAPGAPAGPRR